MKCKFDKSVKDFFSTLFYLVLHMDMYIIWNAAGELEYV